MTERMGLAMETPGFGTLLRTYFSRAFNNRLNLNPEEFGVFEAILVFGGVLVLFIFMLYGSKDIV